MQTVALNGQGRRVGSIRAGDGDDHVNWELSGGRAVELQNAKNFPVVPEISIIPANVCRSKH